MKNRENTKDCTYLVILWYQQIKLIQVVSTFTHFLKGEFKLLGQDFHRAFNKKVEPGKESKINKRMAYVYSGL